MADGQLYWHVRRKDNKTADRSCNEAMDNGEVNDDNVAGWLCVAQRLDQHASIEFVAKFDGGRRPEDAKSACAFVLWARRTDERWRLSTFSELLPGDWDSFRCESRGCMNATRKVEQILVQLWCAGVK